MIYEEDATIATNLGEAYPDKDELARVLGVEDSGYDFAADARRDDERNLEDLFARLLPTLSQDRLNILYDWVEAQLPEEEPVVEEAAAVVEKTEEESDDFAFRCVDCKRAFYHMHEGEFWNPEDESGPRCIDCDLKNRGIITGGR